MLKRILITMGLVRAPKATFLMRHPVKGAKALVATKGAKGLVTTRAGAALGALVAVPVGYAAWRGWSRARAHRS
jgi:hypothetical protein